MGNAETLHGRLTPAVVVAVLLVLAAVVTLGVLARPAAALDTWSSTTCGTCHNYSSGDAFHSKATHSGLGCATCHSTGYSTPDTGACATATGCHGGATAILAKPTHATNACGTTVGCHGYTSPTPSPSPSATVATTKLTVKVSPTIVKVGKSVKFSGIAGDASGPIAALTGAKVSLKVERKVGTKWVKMKTGTATVKATTGAYSWSYKTQKKGSHRVTASIAKSSTYTAKKLAPKSFKVK